MAELTCNRIVVLSSTPLFVDFFYIELLGRLASQFPVTLICGRCSKEDELLKAGINRHYLDVGRRPSFNDPLVMARLLANRSKFEGALVISWGVKASLLCYLLRSLGVVSFRLAIFFQGELWVTNKNFSRHCYSALDRKLILNSDLSFAASKGEASFLQHALRLRSSKYYKGDKHLQVIHQGSLVGVDMDRFRPLYDDARLKLREKLGLLSGDFVIGYIGRFSKDKGQVFFPPV